MCSAHYLIPQADRGATVKRAFLRLARVPWGTSLPSCQTPSSSDRGGDPAVITFKPQVERETKGAFSLGHRLETLKCYLLSLLSAFVISITLYFGLTFCHFPSPAEKTLPFASESERDLLQGKLESSLSSGSQQSIILGGWIKAVEQLHHQADWCSLRFITLVFREPHPHPVLQSPARDRGMIWIASM